MQAPMRPAADLAWLPHPLGPEEIAWKWQQKRQKMLDLSRR